MKCLLVFLAFGLVASDKLDRTYLPPLGAQYSGGSLGDLYPPLEYINEPSARTTQNTFKTDTVEDKSLNGYIKNQDLTNELSTLPNDYSTSISPYDISQTPSFSDTGYYLPTPKLTTDSTLYGSFSPKYPYLSFLPNEQSTIDTHSYGISDTSLEFEKTTEKITPSSELKANGYYNYVPKKQYPITNNIEKKRLNQIEDEHFQNPVYKQFPNQGNDSYFLSNGLNSQPHDKHLDSAFGYYGGHPMFMTFPQSVRQEFKNTKLTPRFKDNEYNVPAPRTRYQNKQIEETTARSFQTPSVRAKTQNTSVNMVRPITKKQPQFSIAGTRSYPKDTFSAIEQRNHIPLRPKLRPERPQAESERNAVIVNYENTISPNSYSYSYDTSNGIHAYESASTGDGVRAQGFYSYTGDDGKVYTVTYTADENGFQPRGDHLPSPPPVPETFIKDKASEIADDGSYNEQKYGHMNYEGPIGQYLSTKKSRVGVPIERTKTRRPFLNTIRENNMALKSKMSPENINSQFKNQYLPNIKQNQDKSRLEFKQEEKKHNNTSEPLNNRPTYNINVDSPINKINKNTIVNTGIKSRLQENYTNKEQQNPQTRRPITLVTDNQTTKEETSTLSQIQNPNIQKQYTNLNIDVNTDLQDEFKDNKIPIPSAGLPFTDNGYYYVPPLIEFNPKSEKSAYKKPWYDVNNKLTSNIFVTEANQRNDFDITQDNENLSQKNITTQSPTSNITLSTDSTRKPYISGPNDRDKADYHKIQISPPVKINSRIGTFPKNLDSSLYVLNTTPMPSQIIQGLEPIIDNAQYYQSNNNPTVFDQTSPDAVFNRAETPSRKPGITVSQDFVTTTSSPIFKDGVLEVNQNVKIYGLRKPESIDSDNSYPDQASGYNRNMFYPTTAPNKEPTYPITLTDGLYTGTVENKGAVQVIPNQSLIINANDYYKTAVLDPVSSTVVPSLNTNPETESNGYVIQIPDIPFTYENGNPAPEQENSSVTTETEDLKGRVIGEDFSGPKQSQKFDPKTGYYYK